MPSDAVRRASYGLRLTGSLAASEPIIAEMHEPRFPGGWTLTYFSWSILLLRYFPTLELTYSFPEPSR